MRRLVFAAVALLMACGDVSALQPPGDAVSDEGALSSKKLPVDAFLNGLAGSWYGEVKNIYRACARISVVKASTPWVLQTLEVTIDEGAPEATALKLSRNGSAAVSEPVYVLTAPPSTSQTPVFYPGKYLLSRGSAQHLTFWQPVGDESQTSALGIEVSKEGTSLRVGSLGGDVYCTGDDGTTVCGTGGYRPFVLHRGECPNF